jgi:hypothetical protein
MGKGFDAMRYELSYLIAHYDELQPRGLMIDKTHFSPPPEPNFGEKVSPTDSQLQW